MFGAGERMAVAAEKGRWYPGLITAAIACVLLAWSAYALSAAGAIGRLPLLLPAICLITLVYPVRGLLGPLLLAGTGRSRRFIVVSSLICTGFGFGASAGGGAAVACAELISAHKQHLIVID